MSEPLPPSAAVIPLAELRRLEMLAEEVPVLCGASNELRSVIARAVDDLKAGCPEAALTTLESALR